MREIKFNYVWKRPKSGFGPYRPDDIKFKYTYLTLEEIEEEEGSAPPDNYYVTLVARRQYTGLKDKNGKEIYEGDILRTTSELMTHFGERRTGEYQTDYVSIEYDNSAAQFKERDTTTGYLKPLGLTQNIIAKYSEVIGNIYENPELVEA